MTDLQNNDLCHPWNAAFSNSEQGSHHVTDCSMAYEPKFWVFSHLFHLSLNGAMMNCIMARKCIMHQVSNWTGLLWFLLTLRIKNWGFDDVMGRMHKWSRESCATLRNSTAGFMLQIVMRTSFSELPNLWPVRAVSERLLPSKPVLGLRMKVKVIFLLLRTVCEHVR